MTAADLATTDRLGGSTVSNDGSHVVYAVTHTDPETFERSPSLFVKSLTNSDAPAVRLPIGGKAFAPQFAKDGWLYFLRTTEEEEDCECDEGAAEDEGQHPEMSTTQVWRMAFGRDGRPTEMAQVTSVMATPAGFLVSPDASKIALFGAVSLACSTFGCDEKPVYAPGPGDGLIFEGSEAIRNWDVYETPGVFTRSFVFDLADGRIQGDGVPIDGGSALDSPIPPFGGASDLAWASNSDGVYFAGLKPAQIGYGITNRDIYFSDLSGGEPANLTADNEGTDSGPAVSPDGRWLAYHTNDEPGHYGDVASLALVDLATGNRRLLTAEYDRSITDITWSPDSSAIYALAEDTLDRPAIKIDPASGQVTKLDLMAGNEGRISNLIPLAGGGLLYTRDSVGAPPELYYSSDFAQGMPVSDVARSKIGKRASVVTSRFSFSGAEGATVWGQIHKLEGHEGELPLVLFVHGGPHGSFGDAWSYRWNPRLVASHGYAVVSIDFHGSSGYGSSFTDSIRGDWGGKPLVDLQLGVATALAEDSQIDGSRACVMGGSYGGYMMSWIAGNWPDRFDCIINHAGLFDLRSMYYTTEIPGFMQWEMGGKRPDEDPAAYEKHNPANFVENWRTPMLVVHGEKDYRVPVSQGLMAYSALVERDIPAKLLIYPGENHWVLGAANSIQWYDTVFDWLDRWLSDE